MSNAGMDISLSASACFLPAAVFLLTREPRVEAICPNRGFVP